MRTLDEITTAARRNEEVSPNELLFAVCAYDFLMSKLKVENNPVQLQAYFVAAAADPVEYLGAANNPHNPEAVAWHKTMVLKVPAMTEPWNDAEDGDPLTLRDCAI